jgi:hypothetical protein
MTFHDELISDYKVILFLEKQQFESKMRMERKRHLLVLGFGKVCIGLLISEVEVFKEFDEDE